MMIIVGLGNPGREYEKTRHNVGFLFADFVQKQENLVSFSFEKKHHALVSKNNSITLIKPETFMNNSGLALYSYLNFYNKQWQENLEHIFVVHDDLDLEFGTFKMQLGKGPKVHNGLSSIYTHLKTKEFWHVRIGVDARAGARNIPGRDYVLSRFSDLELEQLEVVFANILKQIRL